MRDPANSGPNSSRHDRRESRHDSCPQERPQMVAKLPDGSYIRIMEAVQFRVKDIDFEGNGDGKPFSRPGAIPWVPALASPAAILWIQAATVRPPSKGRRGWPVRKNESPRPPFAIHLHDVVAAVVITSWASSHQVTAGPPRES